MQLIEYTAEMLGLTIEGLAKRLNMNARTLMSYNSMSREIPVWRVVQLVQELGMSWVKVGDLLERDFTKAQVKKLAVSIKARGKHYEKPDSADDD